MFKLIKSILAPLLAMAGLGILFWAAAPKLASAAEFSIGEIITYDVTHNSFSVAFEADIDQASSYQAEIIVYTDSTGSTEVSGYEPSEIAINDNGVMAVQVIGDELVGGGLVPKNTYYYRIKVTENGTTSYYYPPPGTQLDDSTKVMTQDIDEQVLSTNGSLYFMPVQEDGEPAAGSFVCVEVVKPSGVRSSYPVAGGSAFGWLQYVEGKCLWTQVDLDGPLYSSSSKKYMTISDGDSVIVRCLGGSYGNSTWTIGSLDKTKMENFECQDSNRCYINDDFGGAPLNKIVVAPNPLPTIDMTPQGVIAGSNRQDENNNRYIVKPGEDFIMDLAGSDASEGEYVNGWALSGTEPSTMNLEVYDPPSTARITWAVSESESSGNEYAVTVTATNDVGQTNSLSFGILVTDGRPSQPTVTITGSVNGPTPKTGDNLKCNIVSQSIDPLGDTVTYAYQWSKKEEGQADFVVQTGLTEDEVTSDRTARGQTWKCSVVAEDNLDGDSDPGVAEIVIVNTAPSGTPTVTIAVKSGPSGPTTESVLEATVDITGCTDADGDDPQVTGGEWFKKTTGAFGSTGITSKTLLAAQTSKGETWIYKATVTDLTDNGPTGSSNEMTIQNTPPTAPTSVIIEKVSGGIQCTVSGAGDADGDDLKYYYEWTCMKDGSFDHNVIHNYPASETGNTTDLLLNSQLARDQTWYCEVKVKDTDGAQTGLVRNPVGQDVDIENTAPQWEEADPATLSPIPAYNDSTLQCSVDEAQDADGDTVKYRYVWKSDGTYIYDETIFDTTSTLPSSFSLTQNVTYSCTVYPGDGTDEGTEYVVSVTIGNRTPTITITDTRNDQEIADTVQVNEENELILLITGDDADENTLEFSATDLPDGAAFDAAGDQRFIWTPPQDSHGDYQVTFTATEKDGQPVDLEVSKTITITVIYPSQVVDDFDTGYSPDDDPEDQGWYALQGQGKMRRLPNDPSNPNRYLNTETADATPSDTTATGQLKYAVVKWLDASVTQDYPELQFFIADRNVYSVEAYVNAFDNSGNAKRYILRYKPENPSEHGNKPFEVNGYYVTYYIGRDYINADGKVVTRNMEQDLHQALAATQGIRVHYDYMISIILRGDIDKIDDIKVAYGIRDNSAPLPVASLTADPKDGAILLSWANPTDQHDDVLGYRIETFLGDTRISTACFEVSAQTNFKLISDLTNGSEYTFKVKVFDDAPVKNASGKVIGNESTLQSVTGTPAPDQTAPSWVANALSGTSGNHLVTLTWTRPTDADLAKFEIYQDDTLLVTLAKTASTYTVKGLTNGTSYAFFIKAYDETGNASSSNEIDNIVPEAPETIPVSDFEDEPWSESGWFKLQGTGTITQESGTGGNHYMRTATSYSNKLNFIVTKFMENPEDLTNAELHMDLMGAANAFRLDFYVNASNGSRYFLTYIPDGNSSGDYTPAKPLSGLYITHYLGWKDKSADQWYSVERNLNQDIQDALGDNISFGSLIGVVIRGAVCIDNIELGRTMPEVADLVARSGNEQVTLLWRSDPLEVDDFIILKDGTEYSATVLQGDPHNDEFSCTITGLTNNTTTPYEFTVKQVIGSEVSRGVTVSATPRDIILFDSSYDEWNDLLGWDGEHWQQVPLGTFYEEFDLGSHGEVIVIDPNDESVNSSISGSYPIRYFVECPIELTDRNMVTMRIKAETNKDFVLWFKVWDSSYVEYNLMYVTGGAANTGGAYGTWAYCHLGSTCPSDGGKWTNGKWHNLTLNLNDLLQGTGVNNGYYGVGLQGIDSVLVGGYGKVYVDYIGVY